MVSDNLRKIILEQLELDQWPIQDDTTAAMVPGWDSLSHARIIAAIEDAFGIRFKMREVMQVENVGKLQALIDGKTR
jgi:acyl carrier protein